VRNRLAVTIASETKSTPPDRWKYYLDTADRTRGYIKKLRKSDFDLPKERQCWINALEALRQIPAQAEALELCRMLHEIVVELGAESD
jgi:hypothetical protein